MRPAPLGTAGQWRVAAGTPLMPWVSELACQRNVSSNLSHARPVQTSGGDLWGGPRAVPNRRCKQPASGLNEDRGPFRRSASSSSSRSAECSWTWGHGGRGRRGRTAHSCRGWRTRRGRLFPCHLAGNNSRLGWQPAWPTSPGLSLALWSARDCGCRRLAEAPNPSASSSSGPVVGDASGKRQHRTERAA